MTVLKLIPMLYRSQWQPMTRGGPDFGVYYAGRRQVVAEASDNSNNQLVRVISLGVADDDWHSPPQPEIEREIERLDTASSGKSHLRASGTETTIEIKR